MTRRVDVRHDWPIQDCQTVANGLLNQRVVVDPFQTVQVRSEHTCSRAVAPIDNLVALDHGDHLLVHTTIGQRSPEHEHVAPAHPDDVNRAQRAARVRGAKVDLAGIKPEFTEISEFSPYARLSQIDGHSVERISDHGNPSTGLRMSTVADHELPPREGEHVFTAEDRERQVAELLRLCDQLADALAAHGDPWQAELFRARANLARALQEHGLSRENLNELAGQFPDGPWWLNPKAADLNAPREPWQEEVADLHHRATAMASDLRAVARLT
jgi:hypothetical protein